MRIAPCASARPVAETPGAPLPAANSRTACAVVLINALDAALAVLSKYTIVKIAVDGMSPLANQTTAQKTAGSLQTFLERAARDAQVLGRLVARLAFPVTKQKRRAILFRQTIELFMKDGAQFAKGEIVRRCRRVLDGCIIQLLRPLRTRS